MPGIALDAVNTRVLVFVNLLFGCNGNDAGR